MPQRWPNKEAKAVAQASLCKMTTNKMEAGTVEDRIAAGTDGPAMRKGNGHGRYSRQVIERPLSQFRKEAFDQEPQGNGDDDDLYDG